MEAFRSSNRNIIDAIDQHQQTSQSNLCRYYELHQKKLKDMKRDLDKKKKGQVKIINQEDEMLKLRIMTNKLKSHEFTDGEKIIQIQKDNQKLMEKLYEISQGKQSTLKSLLGYNPTHRPMMLEGLTQNDDTLSLQYGGNSTQIQGQAVDATLNHQSQLFTSVMSSQLHSMNMGAGASVMKSLHMPYMRREATRIQEENQKMIERLMNTNSSIGLKKLENDYKHHLKIKGIIQKTQPLPIDKLIQRKQKMFENLESQVMNISGGSGKFAGKSREHLIRSSSENKLHRHGDSERGGAPSIGHHQEMKKNQSVSSLPKVQSPSQAKLGSIQPYSMMKSSSLINKDLGRMTKTELNKGGTSAVLDQIQSSQIKKQVNFNIGGKQTTTFALNNFSQEPLSQSKSQALITTSQKQFQPVISRSNQQTKTLQDEYEEDYSDEESEENQIQNKDDSIMEEVGGSSKISPNNQKAQSKGNFEYKEFKFGGGFSPTQGVTAKLDQPKKLPYAPFPPQQRLTVNNQSSIIDDEILDDEEILADPSPVKIQQQLQSSNGFKKNAPILLSAKPQTQVQTTLKGSLSLSLKEEVPNKVKKDQSQIEEQYEEEDFEIEENYEEDFD